MASPFLVDRHKLSGASIHVFVQSPCALRGLLVLACLSLVLAPCRVATDMCFVQSPFALCGFLVLACLSHVLAFGRVATFGSRGRASICFGNCALEVFATHPPTKTQENKVW